MQGKYQSPTTAMDHQRRAIAAARAKPPGLSDSFGFLMDMGTGKSKVILDEFGEMAVSGGPRDLLVIAPAGSYKNWFRDKGPGHPCEINVHMDPAFREALVDVDWHSGPSKGHKERIELMLRAAKDKKRPRALFVNVEALSTTEKAIELCKEFVQQRGAYVAIDESTTIKGDSKRTDNVIEIGALANVRRIASGLWTPRAPLDLFNQCRFLDPGILNLGSSFAFKRRYAEMIRQDFGGRKFWQVVGWKNIEDLQQKVAPWTFRVLKSECLDLEPKHYTSRGVELTTEQRRMYDEIKHFGHAALAGGGFVTTDSAIKQIMRLHQINCGFVTEDPMNEDDVRVIREVPENRTDVLVATLQEHQGKAIVWAPFRLSIERIVKRLKEEFGPGCCAQWHGGNKGTRGEEEIRFLNDPECRYMVATQAAGMRGNTWIVADLVVYYANNYDLEQRDQSEDRAHRKGQTRRVTYVDLIAEKTVDAKMVKSLRAKIDMATLINNEGYREWLV